MTLLVGLTGSIGMGKSTTAAMFAERGVPVWDADAVVHALYAEDGQSVGPIGRIFPQVIENKRVSRDALRKLIADHPDALTQIEAIVHPLVAQNRAAFIAQTKAAVVICDIPLLYETGADVWLDKVIVVTAPADIQRARVLDRGTMTPDQFDVILAKQMPDADKRAKADYIIDTQTMDGARQAVQTLLTQFQGDPHA